MLGVDSHGRAMIMGLRTIPNARDARAQDVDSRAPRWLTGLTEEERNKPEGEGGLGLGQLSPLDLAALANAGQGRRIGTVFSERAAALSPRQGRPLGFRIGTKTQ